MKYVSLTFLVLFVIACSSEDKNGVPLTTPSTTSATAQGDVLFQKHCVMCHGADGKLGLNGAKDLSKSVLTLDERITQVTNGKNVMPPFKDVMSEDEIEAVANYTFSLKTAI